MPCGLAFRYQCFGGTYCLLQPWRWRQYVLLKYWYLPASPHSDKTQKINVNIPWIYLTTFLFPFQINTAGSMCLALDVSSSCQCMAFGDGGGSIHFYTSNPHRAMFNSFSRETEFADPVEPLPPISILDDVTPLSSVPLPYCQPGSTLLSDWPEQYLKKVYR
jgi:hypothetical protein